MSLSSPTKLEQFLLGPKYTRLPLSASGANFACPLISNHAVKIHFCNYGAAETLRTFSRWIQFCVITQILNHYPGSLPFAWITTLQRDAIFYRTKENNCEVWGTGFAGANSRLCPWLFLFPAQAPWATLLFFRIWSFICWTELKLRESTMQSLVCNWRET